MKPEISYAICSTQRSGTHFLGEALESTRVAGSPDEYLICDQDGKLQNSTGNIANIYGKKTLEEFRQLIFQLGSTSNGVFGVTIMWNYFHKIRKNFEILPRYQGMEPAEFVKTLLLDPKYIWLTRREKDYQAVSWAKASQTGIWSRSKGAIIVPKREPIFDFLLIDRYYREIVAGEAGWVSFFQNAGVKPLRLVYEDIIGAYQQTVLEIIDYLGIEYRGKLEFQDRKLQRQSNRLNDQWVARYHRVKQHTLGRLLAYCYHSLPSSSVRGLCQKFARYLPL
jgi:LPS sulfotransferase NodH